MLPLPNEPAPLLKLSQEISRDNAIKSLLSDNVLSDVTLQSNDGVAIRANRCVLAARSPVFKTMLFGHFSEASSPVVSIGYSGTVLRAVVEYIYTDSPSLLLLTCTTESDAAANDTAKTLASLAAAAIFFELSGLYAKTKDSCAGFLKQEPRLAPFLLEACQSLGPELQSKELNHIALQVIRKQAPDIVKGDSLLFLSTSAMEEIMSDKKIEADEWALFKIAKEWIEKHSQEAENEYSQVCSPENVDPDLENSNPASALASTLMKHIHFERIHPEKLATTVTASGLVPDKYLLEAFKSQALLSVQRYDAVYTARRYHPLPTKWKSTGSDSYETDAGQNVLFDMLDCAEGITTGIFQWTIKIERMSHGSDVRLGLTSGKLNRLDYGISSVGSTFYRDSNGNDRTHASRIVQLRFCQGDEVTLLLDLSRGHMYGTLSVSINGKAFDEIFKDIRLPKTVDGNARAFRPNAGIGMSGELRVMDFQKLP